MTSNPLSMVNPRDPVSLTAWIKAQALLLGFSAVGIAPPDTRNQLPFLERYLAKGYAGDMQFLHHHLDKRQSAAALVPNTRSVICVRLDYAAEAPSSRGVYDNQRPNHAIVARYARGRDYHKVLRHRLKQLAQRIQTVTGPFESRPFADSAPIFEKALAEQAGLGWTGKHTLLIHKDAGSLFFLGELFTSLALEFDAPVDALCGSCSACLDLCPTGAIVAPYQLDARRCIAYLTIEHQGSIPYELRPLMGNRVFGCDDCQLVCPWNRYAQPTHETDFLPRHGLDQVTLLELWHWDEETFLHRAEGSPLRRTGYTAFMRNIAVGLGNAPANPMIFRALQERRDLHNDLVREHIDWAIEQQQTRLAAL